MQPSDENFTRLVQEVWSEEISGWDWNYLKGRMEEDEAPWHYPDIALQRMRQASSLLEMGTGGGELFASLGPFPTRTIATESLPAIGRPGGQPPAPLGIQVVHTEMDVSFALPFASESLTWQSTGMQVIRRQMCSVCCSQGDAS
jgi:hypothetical protein